MSYRYARLMFPFPVTGWQAPAEAGAVSSFPKMSVPLVVEAIIAGNVPAPKKRSDRYPLFGALPAYLTQYEAEIMLTPLGSPGLPAEWPTVPSYVIGKDVARLRKLGRLAEGIDGRPWYVKTEANDILFPGSDGTLRITVPPAPHEDTNRPAVDPESKYYRALVDSARNYQRAGHNTLAIRRLRELQRLYHPTPKQRAEAKQAEEAAAEAAAAEEREFLQQMGLLPADFPLLPVAIGGGALLLLLLARRRRRR